MIGKRVTIINKKHPDYGQSGTIDKKLATIIARCGG